MIERVKTIVTPGEFAQAVRARGRWRALVDEPVLYSKSKNIRGWNRRETRWANLVVNQGLDDLLDVMLSGGTQDTTWFVGLTDGTPTVAAGDTLASHAGWVEVTAYDEAARQAFVDGGVATQSIDNIASPAVFTINANGTTVGGAFLCGVVSGTSGRIYAAGAFGDGDLVLNDGAVLTIEATFTMAAA